MAVRIYNSLTRQTEDFTPIKSDLVTLYTCGPTVYDYVTIGNYRTYILGDLINRILAFNGYKTRYVMNFTDVGHLSGDNLGDADWGDDRQEMAAEKQGRSARELADYYISDFLKNYEKLNMIKPYKFVRATEYIHEQIALVRTLETRGFTYKTRDGVYFDTSKYDKYGALSGMTAESVKEGARVEPNPDKRNPTDFALWKFSPLNKKRWQEWDSPWGIGFPGWHLECSAMSMKELGDSMDIHIGGEDLKMVHHQNEIAQSECATGRKFVNYWVHGAFLQVDGGRMGKSQGNAYTLDDVIEKGFDPLALRYFYLNAHYRSSLNFTWDSLSGAQNSLKRLYDLMGGYKESEDAGTSERHLSLFVQAINNDFNLPEALAVMWDTMKSSLPEPVKIATAIKMDSVLGLNLENFVGYEIPQEVIDLARARSEYRKNGIWDKADVIRKQIAEKGFVVEDTDNGKYKIKRKI